jgi:hypothetical protein
MKRVFEHVGRNATPCKWAYFLRFYIAFFLTLNA